MPHEPSPPEVIKVFRRSSCEQLVAMISLVALLVGCHGETPARQPDSVQAERAAKVERAAESGRAAVAKGHSAAAAPPTREPAVVTLESGPVSEPGKLGIRPGGLLVIAPHPDDEALIASGAILRAIGRGESVAVVILTSGDFDCVQAAETRQAQSVAGLEVLGIPESQIFFLGYPDGSLSRLGDTALPPVRRLVAGGCELGNTTYGTRGAGQADVHTWRTGSPGSYTAPALVSDLRFLIDELLPTTVVVTHPEDSHPDHAAAYALVRRALSGSERAPRILRAMVHSDDCWPTGENPDGSCAPGRIAPLETTPELSGELEGYLPDLRLPVPESCLSMRLDENPKLRAIASHQSETRGSATSYLLAFARRDEPFFSEELFRDALGNWAPRPSPRTETPPFWLQSRASHPAAQTSPLALGVRLPRPAPGAPLRVSFLESPRGSYRADFDGESLRVQLFKVIPGRPQRLLKEWLLPHDTWQESQSFEDFELQVAQRAPGAAWAEVTLLRGSDVVGVAIDPQALSTGDTVSIDSDSSQGAFLSLSVAAKTQLLPQVAQSGR